MESIKLEIPLKPDFVLVARLTSSGIATRLGIDFEKLEDIKVVISEVLNLCLLEKTEDKMNIDFEFDEKTLSVIFCSKLIGYCIEKNDDYDLGISIINALTDEFRIWDNNNKITVKFDL